MRRRGIIGLVALCASLAVAGQASAHQLTSYAPSSSFDGTGSDENLFGSAIRGVAVDETSGAVYVLASQSGIVIDKFDAAGTPTAFSAPSLAGANSLNLGTSDSARRIAVDNSGTRTQGRIYVLTNKANPSSETALYAFNPDGTPVTGESYPLGLASSGGSTAGDIAVDPSTGELWIATSGTPATGPGYATKYSSAGVRTTTTFPLTGENSAAPHIVLDGSGNLYEQMSGEGMGGATYKYDTGNGQLQYAIASSGASAGAVDIDINTSDDTLWDVDPNHVSQYTLAGTRVAQYASPSGGNASVAVNGTNGKLYVGSQEAGKVDVLTPGATTTVPNVTTGAASDFNATDVLLHGSIDPDGVNTDDCHFEWSADTSFGNSTTCTGGNVVGGTGEQQVEAHVTGLMQGVTYNYRLVAGSANTPPTGEVIGRQDKTFVPSAAPTVGGDQYADDVASTGFFAHAAVDPGGAPTTYHVEYGPADCGTITCSTGPSASAGSKVGSGATSLLVDGLTPDTTYHYRTVATNQSGTTYGADRVVTTFPATVFNDTCANAHVRQQVSAAFLPDCRAYELVSAADTGGYEVESDLASGQEPFGSYPRAKDRALYGIHNGAIPGPWNPTNHGVDPYVAIRDPEGWSTRYVGIPADNPNAGGPFSSSLYAASADLSTFAFGGADICNPCFADNSSGLPVHILDGGLTQEMTGSTPDASATLAGTVRKRFSADGKHLLFGTTAQLEPGANSGGTDATIYERNLALGTTEVVSTDETGAALANGDGVAALDVSKQGDRVVVGSQVGSPDAAGNRYYHLYMHIAGVPASIDLMPGATQGALYGGMTSDGSMLYFTTRQALTTAADQDTDASADLFRADVGDAGSLVLTRVSVKPGESAGGVGDTDDCEPVGNTVNKHWNAVSGAGDCSVVAIGGAGGVAEDDGNVYFLSPEVLDTGTATPPVPDAPNLYLSKPGEDPHFVTTLESKLTGPSPLPTVHSLVSTKTDINFNNPQQMAVDQTTGDLYVLNQGATPRGVLRFHADGTPHNFTAGPNAGGNILTGFTFNAFSTGQVAIDNSSGASNGTIYVTNNQATVAGRVVRSFARDGTPLATINGSSTPQGAFGEGSGIWRYPTGVAVGPTGTVYIAGGVSGKVYRYVPQAAAQSVVSTDYDSTLNFGEETTGTPVSLAVDSAGAIYAAVINGAIQEQGITKFNASQFGVAGLQTGTQIDPNGYTVYVDPVSGFIYTDDRSSITEYRPDGTLQSSFGSPEIGVSSRGMAVQGSGDGTANKIYVADQDADVVYVFDSSIASSAVSAIDNPLVVHAVSDAGSRHTADFQVTPDGSYAAFGSTISLLGDDNGGRAEVYRYDADAGQIVCASCNPTGARAMGVSTLAPNGLSLIDDGQLFFNSNDALAARDLDKRQDVYKWDGGVPELISTGTSQFDASLLGASADGTDAFFFTRDRLVPEDANGILVKLYDARAGGGFEFVPDPVSCKASDECHGVGSPAPGPAAINTLQGSRGNVPQEATKTKHRCAKGKRTVRRHGKVRCVKAHHKRSKRANANRGGAK